MVAVGNGNDIERRHQRALQETGTWLSTERPLGRRGIPHARLGRRVRLTSVRSCHSPMTLYSDVAVCVPGFAHNRHRHMPRIHGPESNNFHSGQPQLSIRRS